MPDSGTSRSVHDPISRDFVSSGIRLRKVSCDLPISKGDPNSSNKSMMINHGDYFRVFRQIDYFSLSGKTAFGLWMLCFLILAPRPVSAQTDQLFPESTKGFVTITNLKAFTEKLDKTAFGDLRRTPEARDFFESFSREVMARLQKKSKS